MRTQLCDTATMNKFEEMERLKVDRKLLKPQVERRRRERMNRSLETLRILLLQGPEQQAVSQKRVEKAEVLEHTVLFLQSSFVKAKKCRAKDESSSVGHQFLDGFSACLEKATRFLQEESEARGIHDSMASSLYKCLNRPLSIRDMRRSHNSQGLQCVRRHTHSLSNPNSPKIPLRHTHPNTVQQHHNQNTVSASRLMTSPQAAGRQCVWRPWP